MNTRQLAEMEVDGKRIGRTEGEVRDVIRCSNETTYKSRRSQRSTVQV